jgi:hypothetical protein
MHIGASDDVARLLAKFASGALVQPDTRAPSLVDLAAAWWIACGVQGVARTPAAEDIERQFGGADHLVCVIADGLGLDMLEAMPAASFLWQHLAGALRTVFPTTTATALTSFYTASWPAEHAVTGHWLQLPPPAGATTVLPFATRFGAQSLEGLGVPAPDVFPKPSLLSATPRDRMLLLPGAVARGGFSTYLAGGAGVAAYRSLADAFEQVAAFIERASSPTCCIVYTSRIDEVAHEHGPAHLELVGAVRALDAQVALLARLLGGRARIVLTADHGHLPVSIGGRAILRADDPLGQMLAAPPSGDARMAVFHLLPNVHQFEFERLFRSRFGGQFALVTPDEVERLQLLGPTPLSSRTRERLGDFIAIALGADVLEYRGGGAPDRRLAARSQHSGLSAAEIRVPFVLV